MSQEQRRRDEQAMEHDVEMALHEHNARRARGGPDHGEQARLLETVLESDLQTDDQGLGNLNARDFPLSNYEEHIDTTEFKFIQEIINVFSKARFPHPRSCLQGLSRAWATGDPGNRLESLELDEWARDEAYLLGTFSRAMRGEGMAQQETSAKQVTESHAIRQDGSSSGGGGLRGRYKRWRNK